MKQKILFKIKKQKVLHPMVGRGKPKQEEDAPKDDK